VMRKKKSLLPVFAYNMTAYQNALDDFCGLPRTVLARRANMSKGQWSDLLNGKIHNPRVWTVVRVAEVLRVPLAAMVTIDANERAAAVRTAVNNHRAEKVKC
jgi:transcriptional regulator with XRE-family HTH domain